MTLFETLLLAHIAGDWLLQNEWQAVNKSQNPWALLSHIGLYHSIILAVLLPKFGIMNIRVYIVVGLLAFSHAFMDRGWPVIRFMRTFRLIVDRPPERFLVLAVDQSIHIMLLGISVILLSL